MLAEARIGGCVALRDLARLVADGPVQHHGRPPPIRLIQLTSGNVSRAEVEPVGIGQNGEAAGIEIPHLGVVEVAIEGDIIAVDSLGDGGLAAADAEASPVCQVLTALAERYASARVADFSLILPADVREGVAADNCELVIGVGEPVWLADEL